MNSSLFFFVGRGDYDAYYTDPTPPISDWDCIDQTFFEMRSVPENCSVSDLMSERHTYTCLFAVPKLMSLSWRTSSPKPWSTMSLSTST